MNGPHSFCCVRLNKFQYQMDTKTKWHSCRLTVQHESGRVRWCIGHERSWRTKIKRLVFVPAILLTFTVLCLIVTRFTVPKVNNQNNATIGLKSSEDCEHDDFERDVFEETKTSFLPKEIIYNGTNERKRREIEIFSFPLQNIHNLSNEYQDLNETEFSEYFELQSELITWRVPVKKSAKYPEDIEIEPDRKVPSDKDDFSGIRDEDSLKLWDSRLTPEEVRMYQAQNMLKYIDSDVNPCDDFYQYACGNWGKYHPIPDDHGVYDTFEMLRENLDFYLRELLEVDDQGGFISQEELDSDLELNKWKRDIFEMLHVPADVTKPYFEVILNNQSETENLDPITKARYLYKSCMNEELLGERGIKPLMHLLAELRYWPIVQNAWDETNFDFVWLLGQLRLYNNDILISEWIGPDIKNSNEYVIQIDQTSLGLPTRDYFLEESPKKYIEAYQTFLLDIVVLLGANLEVAMKDSLDIINFEVKLAKITANAEDRRNISNIYYRYTLGELQDTIPQIDWIRYFNMITEKTLPLSTPVVCYCTNYLKDLVNLLSRTTTRTITNYVLWRFVRHRVNNLDERFQVAKQRLYHVLFGREKSPPRWQFCVAQVNSNLGMALGNLFVTKHFDEKSKNDMTMMTKQLQEAFRNILFQSEWLDDYTKVVAIEKINAMRLRIGYPDLILDKQLLTARYLNVKINSRYYFENCLIILRHLTRSEHLKIGRTVNKNIWNTVPAIVNAYYSRNKNQIMFPAGILQPPFYHQYFPRALNYGGIGVVIGHEITHGFDDKGRLFDEDGNLNSWWTEYATEKFHEKSKCLIDQYNSFIIPEINVSVDGITTHGENIADNGGLTQAYYAYTNWLQNNDDVSLPGLNISSTQLFFLNFAQVWCGSSRPEAIRNRLKTAVHSPGRFRVLGTLRNSHDFAQVYNCSKDSPMNPVDKCRIW